MDTVEHLFKIGNSAVIESVAQNVQICLFESGTGYRKSGIQGIQGT